MNGESPFNAVEEGIRNLSVYPAKDGDCVIFLGHLKIGSLTIHEEKICDHQSRKEEPVLLARDVEKTKKKGESSQARGLGRGCERFQTYGNRAK